MMTHTKQGRPTIYGMACGHSERYETNDGRYVAELYAISDCYEVRLGDWQKPSTPHTYTGIWVHYSDHETLREARKAYDAIVATISEG